MRTLLTLLLLFLAISGCDQHVEIPAAAVPVDAPARPASDSAQVSRPDPASAPDVTTPALPRANILIGQVTAISDGDTLTVLDATSTSHRIRLQGIDAPEGEQPFSAESEQALRDKLLGRTVRIEWQERDRYGRTLGHAYLDGRYINHEMIAEGWAWHYKHYWPDQQLAESEQRARASRRGVWADEQPVAPWDFRRNPQAYLPAVGANGRGPAGEAASPPGDEPIVYVTRTGEKHHAAGCRHLHKSAVPISLREARERYSACSTCGGGGK